MPCKNGEPDVYRFEMAKLPDCKADTKRNDDLRDDRDIERTLGVASALQTAGVGQGDGNKEAGER